MKKLLIMLVLASLVLGLASIACAQVAEDPLSGFWVKVKKNGTEIVSDNEVFNLGSLGSWDVSYNAAATISPTGSGTATLTGNCPGGYIWSFAYSADGSTWNETALAPLVGTFHTSGGVSATNSGSSSSSQRIYAQYVRILHDATLNTDAITSASASGSAAMTVSSVPNPVPEPGTIVAAMALLAPAGMFFRRKKL